jgi:hypothetical protein
MAPRLLDDRERFAVRIAELASVSWSLFDHLSV